ncbi:MAG: hypothetical protein AB1393_01300 [Candidatus Edwardsbacteria bacterium]
MSILHTKRYWVEIAAVIFILLWLGNNKPCASSPLTIGAHQGFNGYSNLNPQSGRLVYGGRIQYLLTDKIFLTAMFDYYQILLNPKRDSIGPGVYLCRGGGGRGDELSETALGIKVSRVFWKGWNFKLTTSLDICETVSNVTYSAWLYPDTIPPYLEIVHHYDNTLLFTTLRPNLGIEYDIPKTTLHTGLELRFTHHFNYWKEDWKSYNNYPSLVGFLTFDLLK